MKKFLMMAALAVVFAAPAMAEDAAAPEAAGGDAVATTTVTTEVTAPAVEASAAVDVAVATEACTAETNEKVKLPENAGEAEKAQWDAALAECLKGKGVEETAPVAETPAVDGEAAADAAAETPAAE